MKSRDYNYLLLSICKNNQYDLSFIRKSRWKLINTVMKAIYVILVENPYCKERPMNQASGSDLQPYEDGGDALLPWG